MVYIFKLLAMPEVQAGLIALGAMIFSYVRRLESVKRWKLTRAVECVEAGVRQTYEDYVRNIKELSADGKLTDKEREEARNRAILYAKEYAMDEGVDLLKVYAKEYLPVLVEKVIRRNKSAALPFVPFAGPELD